MTPLLLEGRALGPLFVDRLRFRPNDLSPFGRALAAHVPSAPVPDETLDRLAATPGFADLAAIVAQPERRIRCRLGGTYPHAGPFEVYSKETVTGGTVVAVAPLEMGYLLWKFEDHRALLDWWLDAAAPGVEQPAVLPWPESLSLRGLVFWLHALDLYRRLDSEAELTHRLSCEPIVRSQVFFRTLALELSRPDQRWLLPTLFSVLPETRAAAADFQPGDLSPLFDLDLVRLQGQHAVAAPELRFRPAGARAAQEFLDVWHLAVGIEVAVVTPGGVRAVACALVLTTPAAHHLVEIGTGDGPDRPVRQQTLSGRQLRGELDRLFFAQEPAVLAAPRRAADQPTCPACGSLSPQEAKFCGSCGKPLTCPACGVERLDGHPRCFWCGEPMPERTVRCSVCRAELPPHVRCCTSCGTLVSEGVSRP